MAHEETVMGLMEQLVIADKHIIGSIMAHKKLWNEGISSVNNSYKALINLTGMGKLVRGSNHFKLLDCRSDYKIHSQLITKALADILKLNLETKIFREHTIQEIGSRPDAIVFLTKEDKGLCFILEVMNNETEEYLRQKIHALSYWNKTNEYLSSLFNSKIPAFDIVVTRSAIEGTFEYNSYLKEVTQ